MCPVIVCSNIHDVYYIDEVIVYIQFKQTLCKQYSCLPPCICYNSSLNCKRIHPNVDYLAWEGVNLKKKACITFM